MVFASLIALFAATTLGFKWAMYNPFPREPGVSWRACFVNASFVFGLFAVAMILNATEYKLLAGGIAAYAAGEMTGKGYTLYGIDNPANPSRPPPDQATIWEEVMLGQGDVFAATLVAIILSGIVYVVLARDALAEISLAISAFLLVGKIGVARRHTGRRVVRLGRLALPLIPFAFASTAAYVASCAIALSLQEHFASIETFSAANVASFVLGMLCSYLFECVARRIAP
ncbi:hypothetical protein [Methylobacterium sp. 092160098-2]|uniref:hypothetical protein n=1 Tax=Methylobacterium sp. 092160098-2 TaxID=3025129 RepID=UPI002381BE1F|nr:hypothetical protein [Methylobacterium sp. 092160098-2]MDE4914967.1 hypothetical protein [Methylobacterium sp. 092160098-2]